MIKIKTLYRTKWISLKSISDKTKGVKTYYYQHIPNAYKGNTVAILPYRWVNGKLEFMLVNELRPPWDVEKLSEKHLSSITGFVEKKEYFSDAAVRELQEETPYHIPKERFRYVGQCFLTKSCDTKAQLFLVEINPQDEMHTPQTDGSHMEKTATPTWVKAYELFGVKDPLVFALVFKLYDMIDNFRIK
jgi:8-oxo-dGTP pyrophosphatase MutT (NUDIX family)